MPKQHLCDDCCERLAVETWDKYSRAGPGLVAIVYDPDYFCERCADRRRAER